MKRSLIVSFFLLMVSLFHSSHAANGSYEAELNRLAAKPDLNELIKRVGQPRTQDEAITSLNWLKSKSYSGFGGSRIIYSYAFGLFGAGIGDTASFAFLFAQLTARVDAARCADPTATEDKFQKWENNLSQIKDYFRSLPVSKQTELVKLAVAWEEKTKARPKDVWMCRGGLSYAAKFLEKHKDNPNPPMHEKVNEAGTGKTIIFDDLTIEPSFVSEEEWLIKRNEIIARFSAQISKPK
jgi:hypothetical protein